MSTSRPCIGSVFVLTVSVVCQRKNDSAARQGAGPRWTRCRRFPTAFPDRIARWRNLPPAAASPQLPTCLLLPQSGAVRPRNQSAPCSTAIENLPSPIRKTMAQASRFQLLYPESPAVGLSPAWVPGVPSAEMPHSPTQPSELPPLFFSIQPLRHLFPFHNH